MSEVKIKTLVGEKILADHPISNGRFKNILKNDIIGKK
jgi:hypothetical protein